MEKGPKVQRPEDFMDDEDLGEYGIAPQGLKASEKFRMSEVVPKASKIGPRDSEELENVGPIPGDPVLDQFFKPSSDTIGKQIITENVS